MTWNGKEIKTYNIRPPIPTRNFDWTAYMDGEEEGSTGYGKSESLAIADLLQQLIEEDL